MTSPTPCESEYFRSLRSTLASLLRERDSILARAFVRYLNKCHLSCEQKDVATKKKISSLLQLILSLHGDPPALLLAFLRDEVDEQRNLSAVMRERSQSVSILQSIWQNFEICDISCHLDGFIQNLSPSKMKWLLDPAPSSQSSKR